MHHLASVRHEGAAHDLVVPVERQLALLQHMIEEGGDVARVHLAGVEGHVRGQAERPEDGDALGAHVLAGAGQFAVAAGLGCEVDDHRAAPHAPDRVGGHEQRRRAAGHRGRADHDIALADDARELLALACVEVLAHRLGVAAAVLGVRGIEVEFHETRAEALDLLGDGGPDVVGLHDRAQASCRRDRLQAGDAGPDHEHACGGDGAGRGHHQREHLRERRLRPAAPPGSPRSWPSS